MKFETQDEMNHFIFEESLIRELKVTDTRIEITLDGAIVKADNSQNTRFEDVYCKDIILQLENAEILRVVKEGYKYYDANGRLLNEEPDKDVKAEDYKSLFHRCRKGKIFTLVEDAVEDGFAYEFGIDIPKPEDEEENDTYWLCIQFSHGKAKWSRFCGPVNSK